MPDVDNSGSKDGRPLRPGRQTRNPAWRILGPVAILGGSLAAALALYAGGTENFLVQPVAEGTARLTGYTLNLLGWSTTVQGTVLSSEQFAANIVAECTALGPMLLFAGAILAYPASMKARGLGILLGIVVLSVINLVRVISLVWIGSAYPQYLNVAHLLVWQMAIILLAIILWLWWAGRVTDARKA